MGRPKTIHVDDDKLLLAITNAYIERLKALVKVIEDHEQSPGYDPYWQELHRELREAKAYGIRYDLPRFVGRELTASERIRHQEAIRRLEDAGKVDRVGKFIRPVECANDA